MDRLVAKTLLISAITVVIIRGAVIPDPPYSYVEVVVPKNGDICAVFHKFNSTDGMHLNAEDQEVCFPERFDTTKYTLRNFGRTLYMTTIKDYYGVRRTHFLKMISQVTTPPSNAARFGCQLPDRYHWNDVVELGVRVHHGAILEVPSTSRTRVYATTNTFGSFRPLDSRGEIAGYAFNGKYIPGFHMYTASAAGASDRITLLKTVENTVIEGMYVYLSSTDKGPSVDFAVQYTIVVKSCPPNEEGMYKEGLVLPELEGAYTDWKNYAQVASVGIFSRELEWPNLHKRKRRNVLGGIALGASFLGPVTEMVGGCNTFLIGDLAKAMGSCQPSMESVARKTQQSLLILRDSVKNAEDQVDKFGQALTLASEQNRHNDEVFASAIGEVGQDVSAVETKVFVTELKMASVEKVGTLRMDAIQNQVKSTLEQLQSDIASEREILIDERARSYLTTLQIVQESTIKTGGLESVMTEYSGKTGAVVRDGSETPLFYRFHHVMDNPILTTLGRLEFSGCLKQEGAKCPPDYFESQSSRTIKAMGIHTVCCEDVKGVFVDLVINAWSRCLVVYGSHNCTNAVANKTTTHFYTRGVLSPSGEPTIVYSDGFRRLRESGIRIASVGDSGFEVKEALTANDSESDTCDFFDPITRDGIEKVGVDCYCYGNCNGTEPVNRTAAILERLQRPGAVAHFERYDFTEFDKVVDSIDDFTEGSEPYWKYIAWASLAVNGFQMCLVVWLVVKILRLQKKPQI